MQKRPVLQDAFFSFLPQNLISHRKHIAWLVMLFLDINWQYCSCFAFEMGLN